LGLNFALSPELNTGLSFNYSKSDSTSRIVETGDFTNLTAGANWSMTYKFSEKEFVVAENTECLGPYVRTDLGFAFPNNLNSSQSLVGTVLPGVTGTLSNPSISINPGVRFDVSPGYNFNDWLGAEFSAGILYNGLDHLNGNGSVTTDGSSTPTSISTGGVAITGRYLQVPAIVSSVFRWPGKGRWKPYLSTGFGLAYSQLQVTEINNAQTSDQFAQQFSPAFSIGSGFNWQVSDMVDFDAMYKLLGVINPYYSGFHPGVPISNSFQFGINVRF
jgi:opacity protein-like surface antigen